MNNKVCENCSSLHDGSFGSGRFCSRKCANSFGSKINRKERNKKASKTMKQKLLNGEQIGFCKIGKTIKNYDYICEKCGENFISHNKIRIGRKIHCEKCKRKVLHFVDINDIDSILQLSKTTVTKILKRAKRKCERCGWNESTLDIHHIHGKKIANFNKLNNLVVLCPNCHRLAHTKKINIKDLEKISLDKTFNNWKNYYYPSN